MAISFNSETKIYDVTGTENETVFATSNINGTNSNDDISNSAKGVLTNYDLADKHIKISSGTSTWRVNSQIKFTAVTTTKSQQHRIHIEGSTTVLNIGTSNDDNIYNFSYFRPIVVEDIDPTDITAREQDVWNNNGKGTLNGGANTGLASIYVDDGATLNIYGSAINVIGSVSCHPNGNVNIYYSFLGLGRLYLFGDHRVQNTDITGRQNIAAVGTPLSWVGNTALAGGVYISGSSSTPTGEANASIFENIPSISTPVFEGGKGGSGSDLPYYIFRNCADGSDNTYNNQAGRRYVVRFDATLSLKTQDFNDNSNIADTKIIVDGSSDEELNLKTNTDGENNDNIIKLREIKKTSGSGTVTEVFYTKNDNNTDTFDIVAWNYNYLPMAIESSMKGVGVKNINFQMFEDTDISESNPTNVSNYTALETNAKIRDYYKYWKVSTFNNIKTHSKTKSKINNVGAELDFDNLNIKMAIAHDTSTTYDSGDVVYHDSKIYECHNPDTSGAFSTDDFTEKVDGIFGFDVEDENTLYVNIGTGYTGDIKTTGTLTIVDYALIDGNIVDSVINASQEFTGISTAKTSLFKVYDTLANSQADGDGTATTGVLYTSGKGIASSSSLRFRFLTVDSGVRYWKYFQDTNDSGTTLEKVASAEFSIASAETEKISVQSDDLTLSEINIKVDDVIAKLATIETETDGLGDKIDDIGDTAEIVKSVESHVLKTQELADINRIATSEIKRLYENSLNFQFSEPNNGGEQVYTPSSAISVTDANLGVGINTFTITSIGTQRVEADDVSNFVLNIGDLTNNLKEYLEDSEIFVNIEASKSNGSRVIEKLYFNQAEYNNLDNRIIWTVSSNISRNYSTDIFNPARFNIVNPDGITTLSKLDDNKEAIDGIETKVDGVKNDTEDTRKFLKSNEVTTGTFNHSGSISTFSETVVVPGNGDIDDFTCSVQVTSSDQQRVNLFFRQDPPQALSDSIKEHIENHNLIIRDSSNTILATIDLSSYDSFVYIDEADIWIKNDDSFETLISNIQADENANEEFSFEVTLRANFEDVISEIKDSANTGEIESILKNTTNPTIQRVLEQLTSIACVDTTFADTDGDGPGTVYEAANTLNLKIEGFDEIMKVATQDISGVNRYRLSLFFDDLSEELPESVINFIKSSSIAFKDETGKVLYKFGLSSASVQFYDSEEEHQDIYLDGTNLQEFYEYIRDNAGDTITICLDRNLEDVMNQIMYELPSDTKKLFKPDTMFRATDKVIKLVK